MEHEANVSLVYILYSVGHFVFIYYICPIVILKQPKNTSYSHFVIKIDHHTIIGDSKMVNEEKVL